MSEEKKQKIEENKAKFLSELTQDEQNEIEMELVAGGNGGNNGSNCCGDNSAE